MPQKISTREKQNNILKIKFKDQNKSLHLEQMIGFLIVRIRFFKMK